MTAVRRNHRWCFRWSLLGLLTLSGVAEAETAPDAPPAPASETPAPTPAPAPDPTPTPKPGRRARAKRDRTHPPLTIPGEGPLVHVTPYFTTATTTRNLTFGARLAVGHAYGPSFAFSLGSDWLLSGLVAGFLLDDISSPRFTSAEVFSWTFPWPGLNLHPLATRRWLPRIGLGLGAWQTVEFDSVLQSARTEDFGVYFAESVGGQLSLIFPYVAVGFGLRPFGNTLYVRGEDTFPTTFQLTNAVLDVDLTLDLTQLWQAGRPPPAAP